MLRFSLFGFPVTVHWMFWVMTAMLGGGFDKSGSRQFAELLLWVLAAFISILIHELGHTFLQRHFGARAQILLYSFGGLAIPDRPFTRGQDIIVSLAGPVVQIAFGLLLFGVSLAYKPGEAWQIGVFLNSFIIVSIFWGVLNLVPIFPLDGGHVMRGILGPRKDKVTYFIGIICAVALAIYMYFGAERRSLWNTLLFGMLAWENFQLYRGQAPPTFMRP